MDIFNVVLSYVFTSWLVLILIFLQWLETRDDFPEIRKIKLYEWIIIIVKLAAIGFFAFIIVASIYQEIGKLSLWIYISLHITSILFLISYTRELMQINNQGKILSFIGEDKRGFIYMIIGVVLGFGLNIIYDLLAK